MSDRDSFSVVLLGPVVALINQAIMYAANLWVCGHGFDATMHIIPLLCAIVVVAAGRTAYRAWSTVGGGVEDEDDTSGTRTRFVALLGMGSCALSLLVILAQWAAAFTFDPCMRA